MSPNETNPRTFEMSWRSSHITDPWGSPTLDTASAVTAVLSPSAARTPL